MSAARAYIAVPLPPPATWALLRDPRELPDGYAIIGSIEVGRSEALAPEVANGRTSCFADVAADAPPGLCADCPLRLQLLEAEPAS